MALSLPTITCLPAACSFCKAALCSGTLAGGRPGVVVRCRPQERGRLSLGQEGEGRGHGDKMQVDRTGSPHHGLCLAYPGGSQTLRGVSAWPSRSLVWHGLAA